LRKRFIEVKTLEAIEQDTTQVISLGAGFDTLAWRLHSRYPSVQFVEIDHPATSREKTEAFSRSGLSPENLRFLAVDLTEHDLAGVLAENDCFDPNKKTLFICEGVLMYLNLGAVTMLFKTLKQFNSQSNFVFTAIAPMDSRNNNASWLLKLYLKIKNEPLSWSIEQAEIETFLKEQGYDLLDSADGVEMYLRFLGASPKRKIHCGEFAIASKAS
ncbi:MAG: SAM-dependent methyltransferase, partial [Gammaproteobacteria bacterium]|nr:SAM-dependent methyltransferase [Gammaproteobacteria bacterium]